MQAKTWTEGSWGQMGGELGGLGKALAFHPLILEF